MNTDKEIKYSDKLDEESDNGIPKEERKLITQAYDKSISDLITMMRDEDIVLNPDYQREYVWDNKKASLLIESILLNVPIPVVYMSEEEDGKWSVIDGLQRLNSLLRYFDNEFKLTGLEILDDLKLQAFKDLNAKAKRLLRNGIIRIILIFKESHSEIKYDIFMRLNTGSVKLSEQELRNCLYRGDFNNRIKQLREDKKYLSMLGLNKVHRRMSDAELILRYMALSKNYIKNSNSLTNYPGKMKTFLNNFMETSKKLSEEEINVLAVKFMSTIEKVHSVLGMKAFRKINASGNYDKALNRSLMDVVMLGFEDYKSEVLADKKDDIISILKELINEDIDFLDSISAGTSDKKKIEYRISVFQKKLSELISG
jgi:hypothetical protein